MPEVASYASKGMEYFNVTELAVSKGIAGGNYGLFNTSYLYQPVYYSGYITVFTYGPSGLDPSQSVNLSLVAIVVVIEAIRLVGSLLATREN